MQPALLIREAIAADIPAIRAIAEFTWPEAYGKIISEQQIRYMLDMIYNDTALLEQMQKGHQFYIAEYQDQPIGFASVSLEGEEGCKLNKLYILPDIQKTGAGKALLQEVFNYTRSKQQTRLFLQVNKENKAKDFYSKMGFVIEKEYKLDIGGGFFMDDYIMSTKV
ncbi:MAG TPA: N-acetyltransferase [Chitinophagaceae bacterium]|nr:N-acetyltransferase [Chitinophagaceae bacterium]